MTEEELKRRGWSVPIYRAVQAAGGAVSVAHNMGLAAMTTPMAWYKKRSMPAKYITSLCALGGYSVKPQAILDDLAVLPSKEAA
jgi:hypothetical protein